MGNRYYSDQAYSDGKCVDQFAFVFAIIGGFLVGIFDGFANGLTAAIMFGFIGYIIGSIVVLFSD